MFNPIKPLWFLLALSTCYMFSCKPETHGHDENHGAEKRIQTAHPVLLTWQDTIRCQAQIEVPPQNRISLHSPIAAFVKDVRFYNGSAVQKGEILLRLEHPSFIPPQRSLLESLARRNFLKKEMERHRELLEKSAISPKAAQQSEAEYLLNEARIKSFEKELEMMGFNAAQIAERGEPSSELVLRSPVSGFISALMVNKGKYVNPNDLMIEIIDRRHMHLELQVFSNDISGLQQGSKVIFRPGPASAEFVAEVYLINAMVQQNTNSVQVHAHLSEEDEQNPQLRPGMFVQAMVLSDKHASWALPVSTLIDNESGNRVKVERMRNNSWQTLTTEIKGYRNNYALIPTGTPLCDSSQMLKIQIFGDEH